MIRLETPTPYHFCTAQQDLFGNREVWRAWGAKGSNLGNSVRMPAAHRTEAQAPLEVVFRHRAVRGYRQVAGDAAVDAAVEAGQGGWA